MPHMLYQTLPSRKKTLVPIELVGGEAQSTFQKGVVLKAKTNENGIYVVSIMSIFSSVEQNMWQQIYYHIFLDVPHKYTL